MTFLSGLPDPRYVEEIEKLSFPPEEYVMAEDTIYLFSPNGYGKAKLNNNFFEQKLKVGATTRNWRTVNILYEIEQKM